MSNIASLSTPVKARRREHTRVRAADVVSSRSIGNSLDRRASAFLLDLYAMSRAYPLDRFQPAALSRLRGEVPFCSAFWGMLREQPDGAMTLHSIFLDKLPAEFVREWETVKHKDVLAARVVGAPGVASSIRTVDMNHHEFLTMGERFGIDSAMSIAVVAPVPRLRTFLSLYRSEDAPPFEHDDCCFQEIIMPHVAAAWHANWLHHFEGLRGGWGEPRKGFAVADRLGLLHVSDAAFSVLMGSEWPGWNGPELPVELCNSIARDCDYEGDRLIVAVRRDNDLTLLQVRPRTALDRLTRQESEIVVWYREGLSYKQIATRLGCSPYTIRHHLREIYSKLGVCNKVAIIRLAGAGLDPEVGRRPKE